MNTVPIGLVRRTVTGQDAHGNDIVTAAITVVVGGLWQPGPSGEVTTGGQDQVIVQPTVNLPDGVDVTALDAVIPNIPVVSVTASPLEPALDADGKPQGVVYEVDGDPLVWPSSPFSAWRPPFPIQVSLRRVKG